MSTDQWDGRAVMICQMRGGGFRDITAPFNPDISSQASPYQASRHNTIEQNKTDQKIGMALNMFDIRQCSE